MTDVGVKRSNNKDKSLLNDELHLVVICDGKEGVGEYSRLQLATQSKRFSLSLTFDCMVKVLTHLQILALSSWCRKISRLTGKRAVSTSQGMGIMC